MWCPVTLIPTYEAHGPNPTAEVKAVTHLAVTCLMWQDHPCSLIWTRSSYNQLLVSQESQQLLWLALPAWFWEK